MAPCASESAIVVRDDDGLLRVDDCGAANHRGECGSGERVLLVTSGGVIARLAQAALEVSDARAVDFNLSLMNSAISEFRYRDGALRLCSWNTLPHLAQHTERALWSHF